MADAYTKRVIELGPEHIARELNRLQGKIARYERALHTIAFSPEPVSTAKSALLFEKGL